MHLQSYRGVSRPVSALRAKDRPQQQAAVVPGDDGVAVHGPVPVPCPVLYRVRAHHDHGAHHDQTSLEREFSLNSTCVLLVARGHIAAVYLDHVRLQVERRVEDDKFLCEAL